MLVCDGITRAFYEDAAVQMGLRTAIGPYFYETTLYVRLDRTPTAALKSLSIPSEKSGRRNMAAGVGFFGKVETSPCRAGKPPH